VSILERELEEDEAKLDNILHKIMVSAEKLEVVAKEIGRDERRNSLAKQKFELLGEQIYNLSLLADEITLHDKKITEELEDRVKSELTAAIGNINEIKSLFE